MAEFFVEPSKTRQNLLRYSARHPWLSSLTICIDPDNRLHLLTGQADRSVYASLPITLNVFRQPIVLTYAWDGPARRALHFQEGAVDVGIVAIAHEHGVEPDGICAFEKHAH